MDYEVKLEIFEGPLDLLLHLIQKNEVDIFDIPIATITDQYLEYLEWMKALNIDLVGDFLVMAATLIHIKSRMLLPGPQGQDEEDPLEEIRQPLLEYMRYREVAGDLLERPFLNRDVFARPSVDFEGTDGVGEEPALDVNLFQLIDAFRRIMEQRLSEVPLEVQAERWSLKEKSEWILRCLRERKSLVFQDLFERDQTVGEFIVTFLALLEVVHMGLVKVFQVTLDSDIRMTLCLDGEMKEEDGEAAS